MGTTGDPPYVLGITDDPSFGIYQKSSDSIIIFHMDHKENKSDSIMDVTSVYKILLCDEIFKDWQINPIKLTNSPPKVAGPGSSGGKRVKSKPDATGYVRSSSGKLQLFPKLSQKIILLELV